MLRSACMRRVAVTVAVATAPALAGCSPSMESASSCLVTAESELTINGETVPAGFPVRAMSKGGDDWVVEAPGAGQATIDDPSIDCTGAQLWALTVKDGQVELRRDLWGNAGATMFVPMSVSAGQHIKLSNESGPWLRVLDQHGNAIVTSLFAVVQASAP